MNNTDTFEDKMIELRDWLLGGQSYMFQPGQATDDPRVKQTDDFIAAIMAAHREQLIRELEALPQTYAQWVIEREDPVGLDKTVVRSDAIDARIEELRRGA